MFARALIVLFVLFTALNAYQSEKEIQVQVVGKILKFITWQNENKETFVISILNNQFGSAFDDTYKDTKIKGRKVVINYIQDPSQIKECDVLIIPEVSSDALKIILEKAKQLNALTISDQKGFAEKSGIVQISFVAQKVKLKINLDSAKDANLQINSSLLQIAEVIKGS